MSASTLSYLGKDYINSDLGMANGGSAHGRGSDETWPL